MQSNGDDMDDLFRRAAEDYPLNTGSADWEKMSAMLHQQQEPPHAKRNYRQFLWLLLLFPVVLICNHVTNDAGIAEKVKNEQRPRSVQNTTAKVEPKSPAHLSGEPGTLPAAKAFQLETVSHNETLASRTKDSRALPVITEKTEKLLPKNSFLQSTQSIGKTAVANKTVAVGENHSLPSTESTTASANAEKAEDMIAKEPDAEDTTLAPLEKGKSDVAARPNTKVGKRHFYVGVFGGPDLSTVRFEKFSNVGFQAGILLGYQISNRFALEVGAVSSKKYYYSEGAYLDTKRLYLPANTKVLDVDGNCRMIELPVSVLYAIRKKQGHQWFASAGLSSYLMKKEDYTYDYLYMSSGSVVAHNKVYENATKNWLSVLQLSVGYSSKLGAAGDLRLEPYYSIPLKGIGYGALPLSSFGLKIGVTSKKF